jgi:hypothetical protein
MLYDHEHLETKKIRGKPKRGKLKKCSVSSAPFSARPAKVSYSLVYIESIRLYRDTTPGNIEEGTLTLHCISLRHFTTSFCPFLLELKDSPTFSTVFYACSE